METLIRPFFNLSVAWISSLFAVFILLAGIFLSVKLRWIQVRKFPRIFTDLFRRKNLAEQEKGTISAFQASATALAGSLGTGNIVGVATAIVSGGVGAIFWMCLSSFFGMATKYAEILLAVRYRTKNVRGEYVGGPMYYIERGLGSRKLAIFFCLCCIGASFGIGNLSQSNAVSDAFSAVFGLSPLWVGIAMATLIGLVIVGGVKRIAAFTEKLVPMMALVYLVGAVAAVAGHYRQIPAAIGLIFFDAFHPQAVSGGILGYFTSRSIRYGVARGVFSNEAGLGSAPIAHGASITNSPARQGLWGILEVFLDTIVMCTLTTLVILTSGQLYNGETGAALTTDAFRASLGGSAASFVAISTAFFAVSSIVGWGYYGEKALEYLSPKRKWLRIYQICYVFSVLLGAVARVELVWKLCDYLNMMMAIPNIIAVFALRQVVTEETDLYFTDSDKKRKRCRKGSAKMTVNLIFCRNRKLLKDHFK